MNGRGVTPESLARRYHDALADYLARGDEEALSEAYEIGREGLVSGLGVLDLAAAHRASRGELLRGSLRGRGEAAEDFFREALSPFEMAFRGYVEVNTELHRMNDALVREREAALAANRELEAFSYSVSHDLRAPLRAIEGFGRALQEDAAERLVEGDHAYLSRIQMNARRMSQLIDDLLSLSRVARSELARARVDLGALALRVTERLRQADPQRDVEVVVEDPLLAEGDPNLLAIVLENLLGNAWKFTAKRAHARIELGRAGDRSPAGAYFVRDDGAGFDMAHAKRLFVAFQRFHAAKDFEGTGIGLATVQRIVHRHGGRVWAEAQPGRGATFYFTLGDQGAA